MSQMIWKTLKLQKTITTGTLLFLLLISLDTMALLKKQMTYYYEIGHMNQGIFKDTNSNFVKLPFIPLRHIIVQYIPVA